MKIFINILLVFAFALIIFNITQLNFDHFFVGDSLIALIGIIASLCAVLILIIFKMSKSIDDKLNQ
uniref:hypothetical protein n=1 Tax=Flavobacterium sp. TaxID=239 RepID=UPI00404B7ADC